MGDAVPGFQRIQRAFAAYIRDPSTAPPPADIAPLRMAAYCELFFNNIESFMATGFPVLKQVLGGPAWTRLVRDFYARHRCATPLFIGIAEEFLTHLRDTQAEAPDAPPFLLELAHYEWAELALAVAMAEPPALDERLSAQTLDERVRLSPVAWPLAYRFPVQRIGSDYRPDRPPDTPTYLVVYRDREDTVRFLEINPVTYRLLALLEDSPDQPARQALMQIATELQHPEPGEVIAFGAELIIQLHHKSIVGYSV